MSKFLDDTGLAHFWASLKSMFSAKQDNLVAVNVSSFSSFPQTVSDSRITGDYYLIAYSFDNPSVVSGVIEVTTGTGSITISGSSATISGSTSLLLILGTASTAS